MKAVAINEYGGSRVLQVQDMPLPEPDGHDVLIRIFASGINPMDWKVREGEMKLLLSGKFPKVLGGECAGVVEAVGVLAKNVKPGDRVVASLGAVGGGYAQYVIAQDKNLVIIPDEVSFEQAATMVVGGLTALQALRHLGHLRPHDRVLINGAAGGVGTFAVQIAKYISADVTAVCSAENAALVRQLGADRVLDHAITDFTKEPETYQVVFDAVGKSSFEESRAVLTETGVYVTTIPTARQVFDSVKTFFTTQKAESFIMKFSQEDMAYLLKLAANGHLQSIIDRRYRLEELADAHEYSQTGKVKGKLAIVVTEEDVKKE